MPIASSSQVKRSAAIRTAQIVIRYGILFTFLMTISHRRPVPSNKMPAATKSGRVQSTSFVNCCAINGISSKSIIISTITIPLLFFIVRNVSCFFILLNVMKALCISKLVGKENQIRCTQPIYRSINILVKKLRQTKSFLPFQMKQYKKEEN